MIGMARQSFEAMAGVDIPQAHGLVITTTGQNLTIGAEDGRARRLGSDEQRGPPTELEKGRQLRLVQPGARDLDIGFRRLERRVVLDRCCGVLVEVIGLHALGPGGQVLPAPVFRNFVIEETVQSDGVDYRLDHNAATQRERLVILRERGPDFFQLLGRASDELPEVPVKGPAGIPPFGVVPRNATLMLRLDDLLRDGPAASAGQQ